MGYLLTKILRHFMSKKILESSKDIAKETSKIKQSISTSLKQDFIVKELNTSQAYDAKPFLKIGHWNVSGFRSIIKKDTFIEYLKKSDFDIFCMNETKLTKEKLMENSLQKSLPWTASHNQYWSFSTAKLGYSGVAVLSKPKPLSYKFGIDQHTFDLEGRTITLEYPDFFLVAVYVPNAGSKCVRLKEKIDVWETAFQKHIDNLKKEKNVMIVGDLNVAHKPIDIHDPKGNEGNAGYTIEERNAFTEFLNKGYEDAYRVLHPNKIQYSYFSMRHQSTRLNNKGWRLDYCVINKEGMNQVNNVTIRDDIWGSDHVPIEVTWKINKVENKKDEKDGNDGKDGREENNIVEDHNISKI